MSTTLTIRNLEEPVKQKLRMQAASHGRSMEAEAREILTKAVTTPASSEALTTPSASQRMKSACESVRGIWKGRGTTDDMMRELRGEG
jgi:plasmid stability protein